jgi:hypothetical protein
VSPTLSIIGLEPMTLNLQSGKVWVAGSSPAMEWFGEDHFSLSDNSAIIRGYRLGDSQKYSNATRMCDVE